MLNINEIISAAKSRLGTLSNPLRIAATAAIVLVAATILFLIFNTLWLYFASRSYVNEIAFASGWNRHVANAIAWLVFAAMAYFGAIVFSLSKQKRRIGIAGLLGLFIAQSLLLWHGTRDQIIARDGKAIKCYVITRTGVIYSEILDGRPIIEPSTGRTCNPVTAQMAERLRQYETGKRPRSVPTANPEFFDLATGEPIIWFHKTKDTIEISTFLDSIPTPARSCCQSRKRSLGLGDSSKRPGQSSRQNGSIPTSTIHLIRSADSRAFGIAGVVQASSSTIVQVSTAEPASN